MERKGWESVLEEELDKLGLEPDDPRRQEAIGRMEEIAREAKITEYLCLLSINLARNCVDGTGGKMPGLGEHNNHQPEPKTNLS